MTADVQEAAQSLTELQQPQHHDAFVKQAGPCLPAACIATSGCPAFGQYAQSPGHASAHLPDAVLRAHPRPSVQAVRLGMERRNKERELLALLLGGLCPRPLKASQLTAGLVLVLQTLKVRTAAEGPQAALPVRLAAASSLRGAVQFCLCSCAVRPCCRCIAARAPGDKVLHAGRHAGLPRRAASCMALLLACFCLHRLRNSQLARASTVKGACCTQDTTLDCPDAHLAARPCCWRFSACTGFASASLPEPQQAKGHAARRTPRWTAQTRPAAWPCCWRAWPWTACCRPPIWRSCCPPSQTALSAWPLCSLQVCC